MEHELVAANRLVERYVLGELSEDERDSFEEHYFECVDCGEEVRSASAFLANLRAVMKEREADEPAPAEMPARPLFYWLRPAWGLALSAVLLVFSGYQAVVIRSLSELRQVTPFVLLPETRGDARVLEFSPGQPQMFAFPIPTGVASAFRAEIVSAASNSVLDEALVAQPQGDDPAHVLFPNPRLESGRYVLVLRALDGPHQGQQIDRYPFEVKSTEK